MTMELASASVDELFALARAAENDEAYWDAVSALHGRAEKRTFDLAAVLCDSFAAGERCLGADVLGQLGASAETTAAESPFATAAAEVLLRLLDEDDEPAVLSAAAVGLGHLRDERAIEPLAALASNPDEEVRRSVVHGLMGYDDDRAVEALIALSADSAGGVRDWATFALGVQIDRDTAELRDALAARLEDPNIDARAEAIRGLARRGDARAVEAALAADPSPEVDEAIAQLAEATGDPRLRERVKPAGDPG
jgi:HEAT repeat protein